ncbi:MAG: imidazolonepropionase [Psychrobacter sp.]|uniref:imidazolonepropionase n=1 Tax=unclassified Psychrobacter TaxID=196806 RepID=UPI001787FF9C|nr:imidazolonepropionase [Psychrobacter sp. FME5]MBE0443793.1 imidazolonepropionase [Psychrobacter sp. FME5]MDN5801571.1 imidazolonepropionase [Psychrobacter sp.]MDN5891527.1 imidazolonepropionase [Psychrobacter sp.]
MTNTANQTTDAATMTSFDHIIINANLATFSAQYGFDIHAGNKDNESAVASSASIKTTPYGQLENSAIGIKDGKIAWIGATEQMTSHLSHYQADQIKDINGGWITPGLIDCHTHLVYAGNRSNEFEARLHGASYQEVAAQGGGIVATVSATRKARQEEVFAQSEKRLLALIKEGVTSIEIKSGYGLDLDTERKMLTVARQLGDKYDIHVSTTYLAAHALPPEYQSHMQDRADDYIEQVCEWLPILHKEGLVDAVDGFCENIAFSAAQIRRVFEVARALNLPVKLHSEQLSDIGGSALVAEYQGLSSDHLEHLSEGDIKKMAASNTVAVLLPGAFYTLRDTKLPPIEALRKHQVPMAISTDCNPGTSPLTSLLLAMNMGCTLFYLTPEEVLAGSTVHAAQALGLPNKGRIEVGCDADLALWDITRPADLCYQIGLNPIQGIMIKGQWRKG